MYRKIASGLAAVGLLALGIVTVTANDSHGAAVRAAARTEANAAAHGTVSLIATVQSQMAKAEARADEAARDMAEANTATTTTKATEPDETEAAETDTDVSEASEDKAEAADADEAAEAAEATTDTDKTTTTSDRDAHGDAVSKAAKSDCTAAHTTGDKEDNHGGCVSAAAGGGD